MYSKYIFTSNLAIQLDFIASWVKIQWFRKVCGLKASECIVKFTVSHPDCLLQRNTGNTFIFMQIEHKAVLIKPLGMVTANIRSDSLPNPLGFVPVYIYTTPLKSNIWRCHESYAGLSLSVAVASILATLLNTNLTEH